MAKSSKNRKASAENGGSRSQQRRVSCEQVRAAILAEPELPGEMPDCVWDDISTSRKAAVEFCRSIVTCTKRNILERLGL